MQPVYMKLTFCRRLWCKNRNLKTKNACLYS